MGSIGTLDGVRAGRSRSGGGPDDGLSDARLVEAVASGVECDRAIAELWRRHIGAAVGAARLTLGCTSAEDVAADVFWSMIRAVRAGAGPLDGGVRPYLCRSARRLARRSARPELVRFDPARHDAGHDGEPPVLAHAVDAELVPGWSELSIRARRIVWWSVVCGMSPHEIGTRTGLRPNTVAVIGSRARAALRERIEQARAS
jgi:RNA polymerase sigma factor (sigma-70 family)